MQLLGTLRLSSPDRLSREPQIFAEMTVRSEIALRKHLETTQTRKETTEKALLWGELCPPKIHMLKSLVPIWE